MVQVETDHYNFALYIDKERWASYYEQIKIAVELKVQKVLIIGKGDNIVGNILTSYNIKVLTFDLDKNLNPDYCGNIMYFSEIIKNDRFDLIICCQVLEHIKYQYLKDILNQIKKSTNYVIISLPYAHHKIIDIKVKLFKIPNFQLRILIPKWYKRWVFDGQHEWEIGCKDYEYKKVLENISNIFKVNKNYIHIDNSYHVFFLCS